MPSKTSRQLTIGVCAAALLALAACDGPPRHEPPPSAATMQDEDPELMGGPDEQYPVDDRPEEDPPYPDEDKPPEYDDAPPSPPEMVEPPEIVTMEPIPNPGDQGDERRADRDEPSMREPEPRMDRPSDEGGQRPKPPARQTRDDIPSAPPMPESEAASEGSDYGRMSPIPNPPSRRRADEGLMGGPRAPAPRAVPAPMAPAAPARPSASGPSVRVPIRPAPAPAVRADAPRPGLRGPVPAAPAAPSRPAASAPATAAPRTAAQQTEQATADLRRSVQDGARLDVPGEWVAGETREVRLRLPDSLAEQLERAIAGTGVDGPREVSATLTGEGFRIDPPGPQSTAAGAETALAWRVTPESANPGALTARVEASVPTAGGERQTIALGEVSSGRRSGGPSMTTLGWILLIVLGGALLAWLASRNGNSEAAASRRRRAAYQAEQRDASYRPMDLSPGERGGGGNSRT